MYYSYLGRIKTYLTDRTLMLIFSNILMSATTVSEIISEHLNRKSFIIKQSLKDLKMAFLNVKYIEEGY